MSTIKRTGWTAARIIIPSTRLYAPQVQAALMRLARIAGGYTDFINCDGVWVTPEGTLLGEEVHVIEVQVFNTNILREVQGVVRTLVNTLLELGEQAVLYWEVQRITGTLVPVLMEQLNEEAPNVPDPMLLCVSDGRESDGARQGPALRGIKF